MESGNVARILVVDDDGALQSTMVDYINDQGMHGIPAGTGTEALRLFAHQEPDLVVLDLRLRAENGLDLLRDLRQRSDVPVIIASGEMREEIDRIVALELGADDYLVKPFGLRELLARIRAILRRRAAGTHERKGSGSAPHPVCRFGGWQLNLRRRELVNPEGQPVALSNSEYALLTAFVDAPQRPLSREHLLQATRMHEDIFDRSIDVQVLRLRRKLEKDPTAPTMIQTVRGIGYVFSIPVEKA